MSRIPKMKVNCEGGGASFIKIQMCRWNGSSFSVFK